MRSWSWLYPVGATLGEVIFIDDGAGGLLPTKVRTRTRHATGWSTNAFRPFPSAADLAAAHFEASGIAGIAGLELLGAELKAAYERIAKAV